MTSFGSRLVRSAKEAVAIAKGEAEPGSYRIHAAAEIDIRSIRKALNLTQEGFARRFGFPLGTLRDLEQGRVKPDASTRAYLMVISRDPEAVQRALETA